MGILELREISKHFGAQRAVDRVSLDVEKGSFYGLLGPSGCGKTSTLRIIAGFEEPDSGEIRLSGELINGKKPYHRNVSTVFQSYALFPHLSARGNIEFGLRRRNLPGPEIARKVRDAFDLIQMEGKEDRLPSGLSGGEKQRVALARSLVLEPDVLLLDEPLSALDPVLRKNVRTELKALQQRVGTTFVFVTHDQEEALTLSDQIAVMNNGRVEQVGSPEELYLRPTTKFVAGFLGALNWYHDIGVRPELTRVSREKPAADVRSTSAVVESLTFFGSCYHLNAKLPSGTTMVAEIPHPDPSFRKGEAVHLWWRPADELKALNDS